MADWSFLTTHARVLVCIAHDPGARLRDIAATLGITERRAHGIITDLAEAGYVVKQKDGRRNRYQIQAHLPLPEPSTREPAVGEVLAVLLGNTDGPASPRGRRGCHHHPGRRGPAAGRMTTGPARTGRGTILVPATMVAPGLLARCDGLNEARAHYGRAAGLPGSDREAQEISMLAPHLLQSALALVNTRLVDRVPGELQWAQQLTDTDLPGLTQLFWSDVALHGTFELDLDKRLNYERGAHRPAPPDPSAAQVLPLVRCGPLGP